MMTQAIKSPLAVSLDDSPTSTATSKPTAPEEIVKVPPSESPSTPTSRLPEPTLPTHVFPTQTPVQDFATAAIRTPEAFQTLITALELHDYAQKTGDPHLERFQSRRDGTGQLMSFGARNSRGALRYFTARPITDMFPIKPEEDVKAREGQPSDNEETEKEEERMDENFDVEALPSGKKKKRKPKLRQKGKRGKKSSSEDDKDGTLYVKLESAVESTLVLPPPPATSQIGLPETTSIPPMNAGFMTASGTDQPRGISIIRLPSPESVLTTPSKSARSRKEEKRIRRKLQRQEVFGATNRHAAVGSNTTPSASSSHQAETLRNDQCVAAISEVDAKGSTVPITERSHQGSGMNVDVDIRCDSPLNNKPSDIEYPQEKHSLDDMTDEELTPVQSRATSTPQPASLTSPAVTTSAPLSLPMIDTGASSALESMPTMTFGSLSSDGRSDEPLTPIETARTFDDAAKDHIQSNLDVPIHIVDAPTLIAPQISVQSPVLHSGSEEESRQPESISENGLPKLRLENPLYSNLLDEPRAMSGSPTNRTPAPVVAASAPTIARPSFDSPLALNYTWVLFFSDNSDKAKHQPAPALPKSGKRTSAEEYSFHLRPIFEADNLHDLLGSWKALRRKIAESWNRKIEPPGMRMNPAEGGLGIQQLRDEMNFHFFVKGVQPMWEDPMCTRGGKVMFSGSGPMMDVLFFELVLLLVSGEIDISCPPLSPRHNILCGAVLCRKKGTTRIEVWLGGRDAPDKQWVARIIGLLHHHFPSHKIFDYRPFHGGH